MRNGLKIRGLCAPLAALFLLIGTAVATAQSPAVHPGTGAPALERPKVVLIGDSIRLGYAPLVAKRLAERAQVVSPVPNGGDSANVLKNLEAWVIRERPDIVHLNCGLHDLKRLKETGRHQVPLAEYTENLRRIVSRLRQETAVALVFANTTPILDDRHARRGANFDRFEADVRRYNAAAEAVMREAGVVVHDLHWVVEQGGVESMLAADGTHYTAAGYERLAEAVSDVVLRQWQVRNYRPLRAPPSGPQASADYQKAQAERDALVPPAFRVQAPDFPVPQTATQWQRRRPEVLQVVRRALGDLPPRPPRPSVRVVTRERRPGYILEKVAIANGVDGEISTLLLLPEMRTGPAPAVLWLHSSTPDKTQIITPGTNGGAEPLGEVLVRRGYVVMAPDAYWHGDRVGTGPSGSAEILRNEQESLFKFHLWLGRTLWGMFVRDDQIALDYLCARPEVDRSHIGVTGMSMGSTRAWWLAALDERIAVVAAVACLTRYQNLIGHGELRQHGVYYFAHGLLRHFDTEAVVALVAPRPFLALTGELDAGSPADGVRMIEAKAGGVYAALGVTEKFRSRLYPEVGHEYTPAMRAAVLEWFDRWLRPEPRRGAQQADESPVSKKMSN